MNAITWIHIAGGMIALASGAVAIGARKGGGVHIAAGTWFFGAMLVLGVTASILGPLKTPPDSPIGGMMVCYFVATAWMAARRRDGIPGSFEKIACAIILLVASLIIAQGFKLALDPGMVTGPPGPGALFGIGTICLLAGLGDLRWILRGKLTAVQRISRHLWRMCFALFIATGSFFLGQMDVLPKAVQGSPILFALAFAPFAVMVFWLVRIRFADPISQLRTPAATPASPPKAGAMTES